MVKKIALWTVYILIVGLLVFGAANRTSAKSDQGLLFGNQDGIIEGRGQGDSDFVGEGAFGEFEADDHEETLEEQDLVTLRGEIANLGSEALEIETEANGILEIKGRTWRYLRELGYSPEIGNQVVVQGFYENGEFEVSGFQDLLKELVFQIRDEYGRPMWGGGGSK